MHAYNLPRHDRMIPKDISEQVAADILAWFGDCLRHLTAENWTFAVNSAGKYLVGKCEQVEPYPFMFDRDNWKFTLRCRPESERTPRTVVELDQARERLHKSVTIVLISLTSSAMAGKMLKKLREDYGLKKLRKSMIM